MPRSSLHSVISLFQAFAKVFKSTPDDLDMHMIYDVSHNVAKVEEHVSFLIIFLKITSQSQKYVASILICCLAQQMVTKGRGYFQKTLLIKNNQVQLFSDLNEWHIVLMVSSGVGEYHLCSGEIFVMEICRSGKFDF